MLELARVDRLGADQVVDQRVPVPAATPRASAASRTSRRPRRVGAHDKAPGRRAIRTGRPSDGWAGYGRATAAV
jgi:hypothetical protein